MQMRNLLRSITPPILASMAQHTRARFVQINDGGLQQAAEEIHAEHPDDPVERMVRGALLILPRSHNLPNYAKAFPFYDSTLPALAAFLFKRGGPPLTVVDVGANVGDTAAIIAAAVGNENVRFTCIEADETYLPWLTANTKNLDARIVHAIATAKSGPAQAALAASGVGSSAIVASPDAVGSGVALDDMATGPIDILKIDTDGFELEVLKGARKILGQRGLTVFLEYSPEHVRHYGNVDPVEVLDFMHGSGFVHTLAYDNYGVPIGVMPTNGEAMKALTDYSDRRADFYLDLLFDADETRLRQFFELEAIRTRTSSIERVAALSGKP